MPTITPVPTLDVRGVADLQETLTGKRPASATIRSYHSRGLMPAQVQPGRWVEADIQDWLRQRRIRPSDATTNRICNQLTTAARQVATENDRAAIDQLVQQARDINIGWATIGRALDISGQAAWARYNRSKS
jgi:hypothetical protein